MSGEIQLAVIYGSTRKGRLCDTVVGWATREIERIGGFACDPIDPRAFDPGLAADGEALRRRLGAAEAFLVVTPEYNHGYPAPLKGLIDSVREEWRGKPVAFVSYGGISGGLRAVEQLRLVFAELDTVTVRDTVSFADVRHRFDGDGCAVAHEGPARAMAVMLDRLRWWALALRAARAIEPFADAA